MYDYAAEDGGDFEVGKGMQRRDMRDRGKPPLGTQPDDTARILLLLSATYPPHHIRGTCRTRLVNGERLQGPTQGLDDTVAFGAGNDERRTQRNCRAEA